MTITTETLAITASPVITLKGRNKAKREMAYMQIAPLAMIETMSRADMIANLREALGPNPSEAEVKTAQIETTIGRVAARLPAGQFPKGCASDDDKLQFARDLVTRYAAPPKEGAKPRALRAGQIGRRTPKQHKVVRAAEEAWSQVKAELGLGQAQTQKERNAKKATRSTNANPVRGDGKGDKAKAQHMPTLSETLPNGGKMNDAASAHRVIDTAAATLLSFANKNAALLDTTYGTLVRKFKADIDAAAKARAERLASVK